MQHSRLLINKLFPAFIKPLTTLLILSAVLPAGHNNVRGNEIAIRLSRNDLITVFLDFTIHQSYIREKITFVNYVRDRELSQVHIMMTRHISGSAGSNYVISFIGRDHYKGMNNEITYWAGGKFP